MLDGLLQGSDIDKKELAESEMVHLEKVLKAPELPITLNYKKENIPETSLGDKKQKAIPIKM